MSPTPAPAPRARRISLATLTDVLSHPARWQMLAELIGGEPRNNKELAKLTQLSPSTTSKHLEVLRLAGLVVKKHGVNFLAAEYLPAPGSREIDLGGCVMRLDDARWLNA